MTRGCPTSAAIARRPGTGTAGKDPRGSSIPASTARSHSEARSLPVSVRFSALRSPYDAARWAHDERLASPSASASTVRRSSSWSPRVERSNGSSAEGESLLRGVLTAWRVARRETAQRRQGARRAGWERAWRPATAGISSADGTTAASRAARRPTGHGSGRGPDGAGPDVDRRERAGRAEARRSQCDWYDRSHRQEQRCCVPSVAADRRACVVVLALLVEIPGPSRYHRSRGRFMVVRCPPHPAPERLGSTPRRDTGP